MKKSELQAIISKIVREEIQRQIPQIMTEMFVKTIVRECTQIAESSVPRQQQNRQQPAPTPQRRPQATMSRSKLLEAMDFDESAGSDFYKQEHDEPAYEQQEYETPKSRIPAGLNPMFAEMAEDTLHTLNEEQNAPVAPAAAGLDFSAMRDIIKKMDKNLGRK